MIFSIYQDTPSVVTVAEEEGVYVVNTSSDMKAYAPERLLASMQIDWSDYFVEQATAAAEGTFEGAAFFGRHGRRLSVSVESISDDLTDEQRATLDETMAAIAAGDFHPFTGAHRRSVRRGARARGRDARRRRDPVDGLARRGASRRSCRTDAVAGERGGPSARARRGRRPGAHRARLPRPLRPTRPGSTGSRSWTTRSSASTSAARSSRSARRTIRPARPPSTPRAPRAR